MTKPIYRTMTAPIPISSSVRLPEPPGPTIPQFHSSRNSEPCTTIQKSNDENCTTGSNPAASEALPITVTTHASVDLDICSTSKIPAMSQPYINAESETGENCVLCGTRIGLTDTRCTFTSIQRYLYQTVESGKGVSSQKRNCLDLLDGKVKFRGVPWDIRRCPGAGIEEGQLPIHSRCQAVIRRCAQKLGISAPKRKRRNQREDRGSSFDSNSSVDTKHPLRSKSWEDSSDDAPSSHTSARPKKTHRSNRVKNSKEVPANGITLENALSTASSWLDIITKQKFIGHNSLKYDSNVQDLVKTVQKVQDVLGQCKRDARALLNPKTPLVEDTNKDSTSARNRGAQHLIALSAVPVDGTLSRNTSSNMGDTSHTSTLATTFTTASLSLPVSQSNWPTTFAYPFRFVPEATSFSYAPTQVYNMGIHSYQSPQWTLGPTHTVHTGLMEPRMTQAPQHTMPYTCSGTEVTTK